MNNLNYIRKAMSDIMDEFGPAVYRLSLSKTGNPDLASDIYQQTFLLLLEKKPRFKHKTQLKVWLLRTARTMSLNELRRADNNHIAIENAPEPVTSDRYEFEFVDFINSLDVEYRDVVLLFYIEDMSVEDIAKTLDISKAATKTRLHRARKILEAQYEEVL